MRTNPPEWFAAGFVLCAVAGVTFGWAGYEQAQLAGFVTGAVYGFCRSAER